MEAAIRTARRMHREAVKWLNDGDILVRSARTQSHAPALLNILAFEILLKCALVLSGTTPTRSHAYAVHWRRLPTAAKREILATAKRRSPGLADLSELAPLFQAWQYFFERGRYYYELYGSQRQERLAGRAWRKAGAPAHLARVRLLPEELFCMVQGLRAYIEARL